MIGQYGMGVIQPFSFLRVPTPAQIQVALPDSQIAAALWPAVYDQPSRFAVDARQAGDADRVHEPFARLVGATASYRRLSCRVAFQTVHRQCGQYERFQSQYHVAQLVRAEDMRVIREDFDDVRAARLNHVQCVMQSERDRIRPVLVHAVARTGERQIILNAGRNDGTQVGVRVG